MVATREELKRKIKDATDQLRDQPRWQADLAQFSQERARLDADLAALDQLRGEEHTAVEQAGARRSECEAIKASGEDINRKLALLGEDTHVCPLCNSELGDHGVAHIQEEYDRERTALRAQFSAAKREADAIDVRLKELRTPDQRHGDPHRAPARDRRPDRAAGTRPARRRGYPQAPGR